MNDSDDLTGLEPQPEGLGSIFTLHRGSTPLLTGEAGNADHPDLAV